MVAGSVSWRQMLEEIVEGDEGSLMWSMQSWKDTCWPEGGIATYGRRNGLTVNIFKCVQKRAKNEELTCCVEHVPVEVGNIVKYVNFDTRNGMEYIYQGTVLQYGLGLAWTFALAWLVLYVYSLREFSQRNRMFWDLADAGSMPLIEGPYGLRYIKFWCYLYLATFSPGRCNESWVSTLRSTLVTTESLSMSNRLLIILEGSVGPLMENFDAW